MSLSICSLNPARPWCTSSVCSSSTISRWAVGRSWLSLARFPGLDETGLGEVGLTATLRSRYNTIIRRFNDAIEAVRPAPDERNLLDVSYDCPLLMVRGLSFDQHNVPVEYSTTYWLGDKVRFTVSMNTQELE